MVFQVCGRHHPHFPVFLLVSISVFPKPAPFPFPFALEASGFLEAGPFSRQNDASRCFLRDLLGWLSDD